MGGLLLCSLLLLAKPAHDVFREVELRVGRALVERDVGEWARALAARPMPNDPEATFERLIVVSLAGHEEQAKRVLDHMAELSPAEQRELECVGQFYLGRDDYELARHAHDRMPHMRCGWTYVLVRVLAEREDPEVLERWLARQASINRRWIYEQAWFAKRRGKLDRILDDLEEAIRDQDSLRFFLGVSSHVNARRRLDQLPGRFRPKTRYENYEIGCLLRSSHPCVALVYFERSMRMPFGDADARRFEEARRHLSFALGPPADPEKLLVGWTKRELLKLYEKTGQPKRAQALLEELAEDYPDGIPADFIQLAGKVQSSSGMRVIAKRVEEAPGKDTAAYWVQRAGYYQGRSEADEVVKSYREAIRLAGEERKSGVVLEFARWASGNERMADAAPFVRERLATIDIKSHVAVEFAQILPDGDEHLWRHLDAVEAWGYPQSHVLRRLVKQAKGDRREAAWTRAEALAKGKDPSRACVLAWEMIVADEPARAAVHYEDGIARMPEGEEREKLRADLYRAYRESGDWKRAVALWSARKQRLGPREVPGDHANLALCCAKAGQSELAMRIWAEKANLDRLDLGYLEQLAEAGLRAELIAFYKELARKDPRTVAPKRALAQLEER